MSPITRARLIAAMPLIALLAGCGGGAEDAAAPEGPPPVEIKLRHDNFEAIGDSFKLIREQLDKDAPNMMIIQTSAEDISERAPRLEGYFPEGSGRDSGWDTEALGAIWEKPDEFAGARAALIEKSGDMVAAAATGDPAAVGAQVRELGGTCKGCHDKFRLDDD